MGDKVDKDLCDERSGNIQDSLKEIKEQLGGIWKRIDKISNPNPNGMSTRKTIAIVGGIVVVVQTIAEIIKGLL